MQKLKLTNDIHGLPEEELVDILRFHGALALQEINQLVAFQHHQVQRISASESRIGKSPPIAT